MEKYLTCFLDTNSEENQCKARQNEFLHPEMHMLLCNYLI